MSEGAREIALELEEPDCGSVITVFGGGLSGIDSTPSHRARREGRKPRDQLLREVPAQSGRPQLPPARSPARNPGKSSYAREDSEVWFVQFGMRYTKTASPPPHVCPSIQLKQFDLVQDSAGKCYMFGTDMQVPARFRYELYHRSRN